MLFRAPADTLTKTPKELEIVANFLNFSVVGLFAGTVNTTSGIFVGENLQYGWRASVKTNSGSGKLCGDAITVSGARDIVEDPDFLDTWVQKPNPFVDLTPPSPILHSLIQQRKRRYRKARNGDWDW